jgi:hypothetical protein
MKGTVIPMKKCISMLSFVAFAVFASFLIAAAGFTDFSAGAEVDFLIGQGIINGYEDGTFRPYNAITRAEFTAMLCRAMKEEGSAKSLAGQSEFSDVEPSNWASGYIQWAKNSGIINGVGGGRFDPQGNVTYEQTVKMIVLAMGYEESLAESKGGYPKGYMDIGQSAGLYIDVPGLEWEVPAGAEADENTRQVVAYTMYNAFCDTSLAAKCRKLLTDIIDDGMTELEKEKAIHDHLVLNTAYDYDNYLNDTIPAVSYTHKGVIFNGVGVCAGYASATKLLMNMAGIECVTVIGTAGIGGSRGGHAWNIVKINGAYYHLDTTWDEAVPDKAGYVRYSYFNISDETISKDHNWEKGKYPSCAADMNPALYGEEEREPYPADEIMPTLDEKVLEEMLKTGKTPSPARHIPTQEEIWDPTYTYTHYGPEYRYEWCYVTGYHIGYQQGEVHGSRDQSYDDTHSNGYVNADERAGYEDGYKQGYADGYKIGYESDFAQMKRAEAKGRSDGEAKGYSDGKAGVPYDDSPTNSSDNNYATQYKIGYSTGYAKGKIEATPEQAEPVFNLPDLPMTLQFRDRSSEQNVLFEMQINEIAVKSGTDDSNKPNTTVTLSCEILQIKTLGTPPPYIKVRIDRFDEKKQSVTINSEKRVGTGDLGIFSWGATAALKQVGDTFEVTVVFDSGFPNVTSAGSYYSNYVKLSLVQT